jgi:acyl-CoA synthetase (AMP-forming)/AMP-acid ligase II/acyl carrier protein
MLWHTIEKRVRSEVAKQGKAKEAKLKKALAFTTALQNVFPGLGAEAAKRMLSQVTDKLFGKSVMFCINGGSYLRESAMELLNGIGYSMHNGYGMSEIGITSVELRRRAGERNKNSIGHPFTAVEYRLDEEGILQVRGGTLCTKKLVNGEPVQMDGWFDTGDRMVCVDGHYYIQGRRSDTVIGENGENINPDMVESAFLPTGVTMFSVLGLPGENGQELSFVAQIPAYTTAAMAEKIKNQIYGVNDTFPTAMAVKKFYFTFDELAPPTAVKVSRAQLASKIADGQVKLTSFGQFHPEENTEDGVSPLLQQVCQIVAQVLETEASAVHGDSHIFYDLGATSIQYFSILTAIAQTFSITDYDSSDTYRYTPKEICEYIESKL